MDDAVLVASELLTNSVRATRGQAITLRPALVPGGPRVEVQDASPDEPHTSTPDLAVG
ncbi:ATP-binding protein [Actinomadura bangladeshensis]|uniref:ATP-binding protein n=1 Tax=Actinomadura bangladeshensis TaxID=453573 RepID=A0A6L9Q7N0_9ACTN|nr:ATP-binding protein [Actinomadura bangladeshensis]NEA21449.1 ATP-binding protein [Actinomadura bangladeshensis]